MRDGFVEAKVSMLAPLLCPSLWRRKEVPATEQERLRLPCLEKNHQTQTLF
jgi:hypothetical protein